jgi:hypothetical protein
MATQQTVDELVDYYVNLLIIQYNIQPKAQATINILAEVMIATGVYFDVQNAYNVDINLGPTAVGKQLDVIGKYVGVDRYYNAIDLINYFAVVPYSEASSLPSSPPAFGASTYPTFNNFSYNGTLQYDDIVTSKNALSDADFLTLILFMILCNNMNYSPAQIDAALFEIFGTQVHAETTGRMKMYYFFIGPLTTLLNTITFKGLWPAPMGVEIILVENINDTMFACTDYAEVGQNVYSPYGSGFSTYADYATLAGQTLTYSQVSQA